LPDAVRYILAASTSAGSDGAHVHLLNAYSLALADKEPALKRVFSDAVANFPDGKPLVWVSRISRGPTLNQVRGPDLFRGVVVAGAEAKVRHFLLGGSPTTLDLLESALLRVSPEARIVGRESPPFRALTDDELIAQDGRILASGAQIVWVGLGTPKQDFESKRLSEALPVVAVAVGAAFDFTAGTKREAPRLASKLGLEWLFRLATEPRRLWKRYLFGNVRFVWAALRNRSTD
jgi:N-acetylglucosaminyldiphosphoundecaprenol N-acetyl-beta-D-mannosaminyltransferase